MHNSRPSQFNRHVAQFFVDMLDAKKRPPIIKENLHWPPHRNPARNCQALTHHAGEGSRRLMKYQFAKQETSGEEKQTNDQTCPALLQEMLELQAVQLPTISKIIAHRLFDSSCDVAAPALAE